MLLSLGGLAYGVWTGAFENVMSTIRKFGSRWNNLHPDLKVKAEYVERRALETGLPIMFWDGARSVSDSQANMASGASHVSDPYNSYHVWGLAVDYVKNNNGIPEWPPASDSFWMKLAALYEEAGLVAGARWKFFDGAHGQMPISLASVRSKYGTDFNSYIQGGFIS